MRRPILIATAALALGLAPSLPALAHALLRAADPAVGSTIAQAPKDVSLTFSESVEPAFSRVTVTNAAGANMGAAPLRRDPHDARRLLLPLKALAPGVYTVTWHATSTDTHRTQGRFQFTVAK